MKLSEDSHSELVSESNEVKIREIMNLKQVQVDQPDF
jgi:hypothetical protein